MRTAPWATVAVLALVGALAPVSPVAAAPVPPAVAPGGDGESLEVYTGALGRGQVAELRAVGVDQRDTSANPRPDGRFDVEAVLTARQAARLADRGITLRVRKVRGQPASRALRQRAADGYTVFRPYGGTGGIRAELARTAAEFPRLAKLETVGRTVRGTPIEAVKVTRDARRLPDGARPAVLYISAQHAREWITPEMTRRLMRHVLTGYGRDPDITRLLNGTELWFLPVANPDGYDYTFTDGNRLWRKNLRDNDGDGAITNVDGVDLNRNFSYQWAYDEEGASSDPAAETYRGPSAASEPETRALDHLLGRVDFSFFVNYHSAAQLLLYGVGWQVGTPSPDDQIYRAMLGDAANPAVPDYRPELAADLYTTNGDTDAQAEVRHGVLSVTAEMSTCITAAASVPDDEWKPEECESEFIFPDDEALVAAEVNKNLPFAMAVARSAADPDDPVSVVGRHTPDFVTDPFDVSYGRTQQVAVTARRALRDVRMRYQINSGPVRSARVREFDGGERYGDTNNRYYAELRGTINGERPGDQVRVWFTGRQRNGATVSSEAFTYRVHDDIGGDVLVLAAEDVTGISPVQDGTAAKYVEEHVSALRAAGYRTDVYDMDTMGRKAPHPLGVLSHYRAILWETGDDIIPRAPGQGPGTTTRATQDTEYAVRDYLNEGGKLLVGGQFALYAQSMDSGYAYRPDAPPECLTRDDSLCLTTTNDFQQYYLGAYTYVDDGGTAPDGTQYPLVGDASLDGWAGTLNPVGPSVNQRHSASFLPTSSFLKADKYPQFTSSVGADWSRPGSAPFEPYTGAWYVYSGRTDVSYKRLVRTVDLPATPARLDLRTSYEIENGWDYLFVEAHEVGTDVWTTLPDGNGNTSTDTGESCPAKWVSRLHPFLAHYQGDDCLPTGTTGSWNAATGASNGWQDWSIDLSAYAGKRVELSFSYASDWQTQGLGVFIDDVRITAGGAAVLDTSFETGLDGWQVTGPPAGSAPPGKDWSRSETAFDEGSVVVTPDTVYAGFGLEALPEKARNDFVARAMRLLLKDR